MAMPPSFGAWSQRSGLRAQRSRASAEAKLTGVLSPSLLGYFDFEAAALGRQITRIDHRDGIARQLHARKRLAIVIDTFHEVLEFLGIAVLPGFVRGGMTPALLGSQLFRDINVPERLLPGIEGLERVDWIQVAAGAVVVTHDLEPVVN